MITEKKPETIQEFQKSQLIRIIDVVAIGPAMIYAGSFKTLPGWLRISMIGFGIATIFYNGGNFLKNLKAAERRG